MKIVHYDLFAGIGAMGDVAIAEKEGVSIRKLKYKQSCEFFDGRWWNSGEIILEE